MQLNLKNIFFFIILIIFSVYTITAQEIETQILFCNNLSTSQKNNLLDKDQISITNKQGQSNNFFDLIKNRISIIAGYKTFGEIVNNGDSLNIQSVEFGFALVKGKSEASARMGGWFPLRYDWSYLTLPFITVDYRFFETLYKDTSFVTNRRQLNPFMLNVGVTRGRGFNNLVSYTNKRKWISWFVNRF